MDQLTKIKELVTPILQEEDILLYDVKWHTEGKNRILQISIMRKDAAWILIHVQKCLKKSA